MKKLILTCFTSLALLLGSQAQTTVTITATGAVGSFNTGSVNSAGVKNDGNMININQTTNAGWAKFDLTSIPVGAIVTDAACVFTTYATTSSGITNNLYGFIGDPAVITGTVLYTNCNSGTSLNASTWAANAINTKTLNATGVNFIGSNVSSNQLCIGYSRGSTFNYNIYGYPGTTGSQPILVITYIQACSGMPNAGNASASNTILCSPSNVNLSLTGSTNASGLSYQWFSSPDGTTWNPIPTATTIATTQSVTANTYFQCAVACGTNVALSSTVSVSLGATAPFAGTISGATNVNTGSTNSYTVSPATGNIQWYSGSTATGPWSPIGSATLATNQTITAVGSGTVFYTTIASTLGCSNDTSNVSLAVIINFPGDNVCNPIALTTGTSSVFSLFGASNQTGEVIPPGTGCYANNSWCNSTLNNTMWFTFVAPASGNISVQSPGFDTQLAIWSATNCANLIGQANPTAPFGTPLIAANDDDANYTSHNGVPFSSYVTAACLTPGKTYYVQLDSYFAALSTDFTTIVIADLGVLNLAISPASTTICPGNTTTLSATSSIGTFSWSQGATTSSVVVSPTVTTVYTLTATTACSTSTATATVNVSSVVSINATSSSTLLCSGQSATLTANGASSYTWMPTGSGASIVVSPNTTATYTVMGSSSCGSASATVTQNVSLCTGVADALASSQVSLYPNPNYGVVTIELTSELTQNASILIYDALGKIVISEKLTTEITLVKTAQLNNGVYFYKVISNNKDVKIGKLVKQ